MSDNDTSRDYIERPPATVGEAILANCRPQPAIPAVLVMLMFVLLPTVGGWSAMLIAAGTIVSCGLAIAAGFCSFFPPLAWLAVALWCSSLPAFAALPGYNLVVLIAGGVAAVAMLGVQLWRVRTGKFIPTIREYPEERV